VFCTYCGVKLQPEVKVENLRIEAELKELREAVSVRGRADRRIPPWAVILPFIGTTVFAVVLVAAAFSKILEYDLSGGVMPTQEEILGDMEGYIVAALVFNVLFYLAYAVIAYMMVDRANRHLDREAATMRAFEKALEKVGGSAGRAQNPWGPGESLAGNSAYGTKRNALLWAAAIALPLAGSLAQDYAVLVGDFDLSSSLQFVSIPLLLVHAVLMFYMLHFVTDDMWRHDQEWTGFARATKVSLARAGATAGGLDEGYPLEKKPTVLFVVVTFLTMGLFLVYWWYAAVKDTNSHYEKQARFEDQLLGMLSGRP
jgi:hypothetical protein